MATERSTLEIILEGKDLASDDLKRASQNLAGLQTQGEKTAAGLTNAGKQINKASENRRGTFTPEEIAWRKPL